MSPPPKVCPQPGAPASTNADEASCPLWSARQKLHFQRNIEADAAARLGLSTLVQADLNGHDPKPKALPTNPILINPPEPTDALPVAESASLKGANHGQPA
jgi:hypothetical protein